MENYFTEIKIVLSLFLHKLLNSFTYSLCSRCNQNFINEKQSLICTQCIENSLLTKATGVKITENGIRIYFTSLYKKSLLSEVLMESSIDLEEQLKFNQELILKFKHEKPNLCLVFSEYLDIFFRKYLADLFSKKENLIISYVAAYPKRKYNQAFLLAKYFYKSIFKSQKIKLSFAKDLFYRIKDTHRLVDLNPEERRSELKNAFTLNEILLEKLISKNITEPQKYHNFKILIIDDITTTGATIDSISELLLERGIPPEQILGFTVLGRNYHEDNLEKESAAEAN